MQQMFSTDQDSCRKFRKFKMSTNVSAKFFARFYIYMVNTYFSNLLKPILYLFDGTTDYPIPENYLGSGKIVFGKSIRHLEKDIQSKR